ncbi:MAG: hypothetical protein ABIM20_03555 [candidate division WOR-3 bacterium]
MVFLMILTVTYLSMDFSYTHTDNFFLDSTGKTEKIYNIGIGLRNFTKSADLVYSFNVSGTLLSFNPEYNQLKPQIGISRFKSFLNPGSYMDFGATMSYNISSTYSFFQIEPYFGHKVYLTDFLLLRDVFYLTYTKSGNSFAFDLLPELYCTSEFLSFTFMFAEKMGIRNLYQGRIVSSGGSGHLPRETIIYDEYLFLTSYTSIRVARNLFDGVGLYYEFGYRFRPSWTLVSARSIVDVNDPLNSDTYAYKGPAHTLGLSVFASKLRFGVGILYQIRHYELQDTLTPLILRNDRYFSGQANLKLTLIDSIFEFGLNGSFSYTQNLSDFDLYTFHETFWSAGFYFNF